MYNIDYIPFEIHTFLWNILEIQTRLQFSAIANQIRSISNWNAIFLWSSNSTRIQVRKRKACKNRQFSTGIQVKPCPNIWIENITKLELSWNKEMLELELQNQNDLPQGVVDFKWNSPIGTFRGVFQTL